MKTVRLFWNHICILHHFEKSYLQQLQDRLLEQEIKLEITYFGLGYPHHMAEYLLETNDLPDIIVSADLEVFEQKQIFQSLFPLYKTQDWLPLNSNPIIQRALRHAELLPIIAIPMVLYGKKHSEGLCLPELAKQYRVGFGGINNSAGKTTVKALWQTYGKEVAETFLKQCNVYDMPINAFQHARTGNIDLAIVPSIYGKRADQIDSFQSLSKEGTILLPSYFCARKTIDEQTARTICGALLSQELMNFYSSQGDLISCIARNTEQSTFQTEENATEVTQTFIDKLNDDEFYDLYCRYIPSAKNLSK